MKLLGPPMAFGLALIIWHLATLYSRSLMDYSISHTAVMAVALVMALLPLMLFGSDRDLARYLEGLAFTFRGALLGMSCLIIGAVYFWTFSKGERVFVQMGFMVVLLAYYEVNSVTNRFILHIADPGNETSSRTLLRTVSNQGVTLLTVFVMATGGLYLGLMGVLGFRSVWSVLILASALLMLIFLMVKARKL